jgi:hypothetical protein
MSSETDHPRQRTVAELLAEHGAAGATTGRRRRRREPDADGGVPVDIRPPAQPVGRPPAATSDAGTTAVAPVHGGRTNGNGPSNPTGSANGNGLSNPTGAANGNGPSNPIGAANGNGAHVNGNGVAPAAWAFPSATPDRSVLREPVPQEPAPRDGYVAPDFGPRAYSPEPLQPPARPRISRESPTEHFPRFGGEQRTGVLDPGLTGPIEQPPGPSLDEPTLDSDDGGPATMVGAAPKGAEAWHRSRTRARTDSDGGPATEAAPMPDFDDHPAGLAGDEDDDGAEEPRRRLGRSAGRPRTGQASAGQAWAAVVAQWIVGAVGGAALWVGFRFLWRELPVVALAAAVLVTVGLVLVVRALLRNSDMRTTVFAVLVGLLLTVSPAILVLLGR